jgi:aryl-alcohol dehydrogenase-like predicted oxidoreductase
MDTVDKLRELIEPADMVRTSLQYVISHPTLAVAIPGAKSVEQAAMNAAAGDDELSEAELERLRV